MSLRSRLERLERVLPPSVQLTVANIMRAAEGERIRLSAADEKRFQGYYDAATEGPVG